MQPLRRRINPKTFVITLRQIAKHLKINQKRILNWQRWHNVLWVHIQGLGSYFVSYRKLEQWIAACHTLIHSCKNLPALDALWLVILQEAQRYTARSTGSTQIYLAATIHRYIQPSTNLAARFTFGIGYH
ncbi:MAG TPA: hypothetical protein V6D14_20715 [Coleofasciculaceae cyanobacterium]|jgi:hypothetical protein